MDGILPSNAERCAAFVRARRCTARMQDTVRTVYHVLFDLAVEPRLRDRARNGGGHDPIHLLGCCGFLGEKDDNVGMRKPALQGSGTC